MLFILKQLLYFPWKYTKLVNCHEIVIILSLFKFFNYTSFFYAQCDDGCEYRIGCI
jgi:hypothetical protein